MPSLVNTTFPSDGPFGEKAAAAYAGLAHDVAGGVYEALSRTTHTRVSPATRGNR